MLLIISAFKEFVVLMMVSLFKVKMESKNTEKMLQIR